MDTRYELLSGDDVIQEGDLLITDYGTEVTVQNNSEELGCMVGNFYGFALGWYHILRPPTNN